MDVMLFRLVDLQMLMIYHKKPWEHGFCRAMEGVNHWHWLISEETLGLRQFS